MTENRRAVRRAARAGALLLLAPLLFGSDHADPIDPFDQEREEGGLTDLFAFPKGDQLVLILCLRRHLVDSESKYLEGYTYDINLDTKSTVKSGHDGYCAEGDKRLSVDEATARYGGCVAHPEDIDPTVTLRFRLNNDGTIREHELVETGGIATETKDGKAEVPGARYVGGVFNDPFIFPAFYSTNVFGIVASVPLAAFADAPKSFVIWATASMGKRQIDHVGRSLRTQNPRFELLNTLAPKLHAPAIQHEHEHPSLMRDLLRRLGLEQTFAYRTWDFVPDVMILVPERTVGFPNGRLLTDDVAKLLAEYGDTLLYELSFSGVNATWPRYPEHDAFLEEFPYLAPPQPDPKAPMRPPLSSANRAKLLGIAFGIVAFLAFTHWLFAWLYYRWRQRRRYL